jgi:hypothetical protein
MGKAHIVNQFDLFGPPVDQSQDGIRRLSDATDMSFCGHAILQDDIFKMLHVLIYLHFARNSMGVNAHCLVDALAHTNSDSRAL